MLRVVVCAELEVGSMLTCRKKRGAKIKYKRNQWEAAARSRIRDRGPGD